MNRKSLLFGVILTTAIMSCNHRSNNDDSGSQPPAAEGDGKKIDTPKPSVSDKEIFECADGNKCDASSQYCLATYRGRANLTSKCEPLPAANRSCSWAREDALKKFSNSNNCSGIISCEQNNNVIKVTCQI